MLQLLSSLRRGWPQAFVAKHPSVGIASGRAGLAVGREQERLSEFCPFVQTGVWL